MGVNMCVVFLFYSGLPLDWLWTWRNLSRSKYIWSLELYLANMFMLCWTYIWSSQCLFTVYEVQRIILWLPSAVWRAPLCLDSELTPLKCRREFTQQVLCQYFYTVNLTNIQHYEDICISKCKLGLIRTLLGHLEITHLSLSLVHQSAINTTASSSFRHGRTGQPPGAAFAWRHKGVARALGKKNNNRRHYMVF